MEIGKRRLSADAGEASAQGKRGAAGFFNGVGPAAHRPQDKTTAAGEFADGAINEFIHTGHRANKRSCARRLRARCFRRSVRNSAGRMDGRAFHGFAKMGQRQDQIADGFLLDQQIERLA